MSSKTVCFLYCSQLCGGSVVVRGREGEARAVLGRYSEPEPQHDCFAPEMLQGGLYTVSTT